MCSPKWADMSFSVAHKPNKKRGGRGRRTPPREETSLTTVDAFHLLPITVYLADPLLSIDNILVNNYNEGM